MEKGQHEIGTTFCSPCSLECSQRHMWCFFGGWVEIPGAMVDPCSGMGANARISRAVKAESELLGWSSLRADRVGLRVGRLLTG